MISTRANWDRADLWQRDDNSGRQKINLSEWTAPAPVILPRNAMITATGKTDNNTLLSATPDCGNNDALLSPFDSLSMVNKWTVTKVQGTRNQFTIQNTRNCNRTFLSVAGGCGQTFVDLWTNDDGSGKQRWTAKPVDGKEDTYTFTVGGRNCGRIHLSTRDVWDRVDLWSAIDNDNQWYSVAPWKQYKPEQVNVGGKQVVRSLGKTDDRHFLAAKDDGCDNNAFLAADKANGFEE